MTPLRLAALALAAAVLAAGLQPAPPASAQAPLRIMVLGAHPDDCELDAGGCAAKWAALGHKVKFVSLTNGDIGHSRIAGGPLAQRRIAEAKRCAEILGIETEVMDNHDGELEPTLENRRKLTRLIRNWRADVVIGHRPNDYHPDHRNVGVLMQDTAYMVTVPFFCPDTPHLTRNPVFLFSDDNFQKPNPFQGDVVIAIDDVIEKKMACVRALESQFFEAGATRYGGILPTDEAGRAARRKQVDAEFLGRFSRTADRHRAQLRQWYGDAKGRAAKYAEAFEVCEYGRRPDREELKRIFPF